MMARFYGYIDKVFEFRRLTALLIRAVVLAGGPLALGHRERLLQHRLDALGPGSCLQA